MNKIIEKLEKLGYLYQTELYSDGTVCTYKFIRHDCMRDGCFWEVAIEDHTVKTGLYMSDITIPTKKIGLVIREIFQDALSLKL